jgi:hypothetical protein
MLVFLDTEFTDFVQPGLISIALVAEDGREFYAERTDYRQGDCTDFVRSAVLPLLGRVPGAACTAGQLTARVRQWFEALPEQATLVYDAERDWLLLAQAWLGGGHQGPPANVGGRLYLDSRMTAQALFEQAQQSVYCKAWPVHHALADARALRAGYFACQAR